jgi:hypothetical protein
VDTSGPEFSYEGARAGVFKEAPPPARDGVYRYEPDRGVGHYRMQTDLKAVGSVRCSYLAQDRRVSFTVCACPEYGVLQLAAFRMEPSAP